MDSAKDLDCLVDRVFDIFLLCHVTGDAENAFLEISMKRLHPSDIHISDGHRGTLRVHLSYGCLAKARSSSSHEYDSSFTDSHFLKL